MGDIHWHASVENVLLNGVSAWIFLFLLKQIAQLMVTRGGAVAGWGKAIGATLP